MEKLLEQIRIVYQNCAALQETLKQKNTRANEIAAQQMQLAEGLKVLKANLDEREKNIAVIENLEQYRKDAEALEQRAKGLLAECQRKAESFAAYEQAKKKELTEHKEELDKREAALREWENNKENIILENVRRALKK